MALYPPAVKKLIRPGSNDPAIEVVGAILHVAVSEADSLFAYFNGPSGGIESHFYIRRDGTVEQYRDTGYEADANYKANSFFEDGRRKGFVSIETQGMGHGVWSAQQMTSIRRLLTWLAATHKFPLRKATTSTGPGVGYHTLFPGVWTPYTKSCPGADRIRQFEHSLVPWMGQVSSPGRPDQKHLDDARRAAWRAARIAREDGHTGRWRRLRRVIRILKALGAN